MSKGGTGESRAPATATTRALSLHRAAADRVLAPPAKSALALLDATTGAFTYTPNPDAVGYDTFTFAASDGTASSTASCAVFVVAGLGAELWDGDPFAGGQLASTLPDLTVPYDATVSVPAAVPEPATLLLLSGGLVLASFGRCRTRYVARSSVAVRSPALAWTPSQSSRRGGA